MRNLQGWLETRLAQIDRSKAGMAALLHEEAGPELVEVGDVAEGYMIYTLRLST